MKIKAILIGLLIMLSLISTSAIYAEDATVSDSTFTIPEGFTVNETQDKMVVLTNDENTAIVVLQGEESDTDQAKATLEEKGYTFVGEETYDASGVSITQQNYNKDGINSCLYVFTKNDKHYAITLNLPENQEIPENENNPVTGIVSSIE